MLPSSVGSVIIVHVLANTSPECMLIIYTSVYNDPISEKFCCKIGIVFGDCFNYRFTAQSKGFKTDRNRRVIFQNGGHSNNCMLHSAERCVSCIFFMGWGELNHFKIHTQSCMSDWILTDCSGRNLFFGGVFLCVLCPVSMTVTSGWWLPRRSIQNYQYCL